MNIINSARKLIGNLRWRIKARNKFLSLHCDNVCLSPGVYYVICSSREYLIHKDVPIFFLKSINGPTNNKSIIRVIVEKGYQSNFQAQVVMSTNNGYRYFDYFNRTTFKPFLNENEYLKYQDALIAFSSSFSLTNKEVNKNYCVENIIDSKPRNNWCPEELYKNFYLLFDRYVLYLSHARIIRKQIDYNICSISGMENYNGRITNLVNQIDPSIHNTVFSFSHCDLHFGNTLFNNDDIFLIDFEEAKENVFYYDIFNLIFVEYRDWNNSSFLDMYLTGDSHLEASFIKLFNAVGELFNPVHSKDYLISFIALRMKNDIERALYSFQKEDLDIIIAEKVKEAEEWTNYIINYK